MASPTFVVDRSPALRRMVEQDLFDMIRSLHKQHKQHQAGASSGKGLKRRVWPPSSTSTDSGDDEAIDHPASGEDQEKVMDQPGGSRSASPAPPIVAAAPEDVMKGHSGTNHRAGRSANRADVAEQHIKAELKRLIETEEVSHLPQI